MTGNAPRPTATRPTDRAVRQRPQAVGLAESVRGYLAEGWCVLPFVPRTKKAFDKWAERIAVSPEEWEEWLTLYPTSAQAGLGVILGACRAPAGKQLVDVEADDPETEAWIQRQSPLPKTLSAQSRRSVHRFYWAPKDRRQLSALAAKKGGWPEVRAGRNIAIVPPSRHKSGATYHWLPGLGPGEVEIADLPQWGIDLMPLKTPPRTPSKAAKHKAGAGTRYGQAALKREAEELAAMASDSGRNAKLNEAAFSLGQLVAGGALDEGSVRTGLIAACERNGLVADDGARQCEQTLESGLNAGMLQPRTATDTGKRTARMDRRASSDTARPIPEAGPGEGVADAASLPTGADLIVSNSSAAPSDSASTIQNAMRMTPEETRLLSFAPTDRGNAEALAAFYGDELRFDHLRQKWFVFKGSTWEPDCDGELPRRCKTLARLRGVAASKVGDGEGREKARKWAQSTESQRAIAATIESARSEAPMYCNGRGWDADPLLLGVPNGVVDLRKGTLRAGRPEDSITLRAGVPYDPHAECPRWKQFLREVFDGSEELIGYVWRAIGYSMTGSTHEQCFFLLYGRGANGKSVFFSVQRHVLGDYAHSTGFSLFDHASRNDHSQNQAQLELKRFVTASESSENTRLNEDRLKALAGSDPITAHLMRENDRTFENTCKVWLGVNHKPRVHDDTDGFWRKARLIPFTRQFLGDDADPDLCAKLRAEAAGILRWGVQGAVTCLRDGLRTPEIVLAASSAWREEADPLGEFLSDCCVFGENCQVKAADLFSAYTQWSDDNGVRERDRMGSTAFGRRVGERFSKKRAGGGKGNVYLGIGVRDDDGEQDV